VRRLFIILAVIAVLLAGSAVALWAARQPVAQWATLRLLDGQGLGPAALTVDRIDATGLEARDVSLRGGALRLNALTVAFDPRALRQGQIGLITLDGLKIVVARDERGITLGGQGFESSTADAGGAAPIDGLSLDRIRLTNAELTIKGLGPYETLRIATADIGVRLMPGGALSLTLADGALVVPGLPWTVAGAGGTLTRNGSDGQFAFEVATLASTAKPAVMRPATLKLAGRFTAAKVDFTAQAGIAAAGSRLALTATGRHDLATNAGQTDLVMAPVTLRPDGLQPADFFPIVGALPVPFGGTVSAQGKLAWKGSTITPDLTVRLAGANAQPPGADVTDLQTAIRITGLTPPATAPGQVLTATVTGGGLPPTPVTLGFQVRASRLNVERLEAGLAGGRVTAAPFAVAADGPLAVATTLSLAAVDLAEVFKLIDIDGLGGTGKIAGDIPLRWADGRLSITGGELATDGPGRLHLSGENLPAALTQAGEQVALALTALADFHYESLSLALDKEAAGQGTVRITIRGSNPQVMDGHPFVFNIKVESDFDRLTELALSSMSATQDLLRRAERSISP